MVRKRLRGNINVQELYSNTIAKRNPDATKEDLKKPDMSSDKFYLGATNIIKTYLMAHLINKGEGYYKNGEKQSNFDDEDLNDCFTYIYGKILDKYDHTKGTLATFIRTWVQGYGTIVIQKQVRQHKYLNVLLPLDFNLQKSISDDYKDPFTFDDLGNIIDEEHFGSGHLFSFTSDEIEDYRKKIELTFTEHCINEYKRTIGFSIPKSTTNKNTTDEMKGQ